MLLYFYLYFILTINQITSTEIPTTKIITLCPVISATLGKIAITPESTCNFTLLTGNARYTVSYTGALLGGWWYGIILYDCIPVNYEHHCTGYVISRLDGCLDCTFCQHDELIPKCRSKFLPIIIAITTYTCIILCVYIIHRKILYRCIWYKKYILYPIVTCRSKYLVKRERRIDRLHHELQLRHKKDNVIDQLDPE